MTLDLRPLIHAEISVIPIISNRGDNKNTNSDSGMSKYIAKAFDAIRKIEGINVVLTSMGTHIETTDFEKILKAIDATHDSLRREGNVTRIISTIRIDERRDKSATFDDRISSVQKNCRIKFPKSTVQYHTV
jgi:uncharacterized protein (TIGR00106 family)